MDDYVFDGLLIFLMSFFGYFGSVTLFSGSGSIVEMISGVVGLFVSGALFIAFSTRLSHTVKKNTVNKTNKDEKVVN